MTNLLRFQILRIFHSEIAMFQGSKTAAGERGEGGEDKNTPRIKYYFTECALEMRVT